MVDINLSKKYGILLSGGLDSAVLLYTLISAHPTIDIQPFTIPNRTGAALYVNPIIDHFNNKFNLSIPHTIFAGNPELYHAYQSRSEIGRAHV